MLLLVSQSASATVLPQTVDSLLEAYKITPPTNRNSAKEVVARQIVDLCMECEMLIETPLEIRKGMPADSMNLMVFFAAARYYYYNAYFAECLDYVEQALPLAANNDMTLHATLLCDRCYCLFKQGRMTEAIEAGQQAMQFCLNLGPSVYLARAYLYLAICNNGLPNPPQAKAFIQKAIEVDEQIGTNNNSHNILGVASEIYAIGQEPERAIVYGERAIEAARAIGYKEGVVNHLSQLSYAYNRKGDYQRGLEVARQAVSEVELMDVPDRNLLAISLEYVAYNLLDLKRNAEAVPILLRAIGLEQEVGNTRAVCYDYRSLAEAYEPDEPRQAVAALRKYIVMADSIHSAQMSEALGQANAKFRNNELQDENMARRRQNQIIIIASAAVALLLLAVIAFIVYAYRLRGKVNCSLKQQQQAQDAFFTNVTHEFRTPLTVILGLSRQLQEKEDTTAPLAPPSAPEGATIAASLDSKTIEAPSGAVGGAKGPTAPSLIEHEADRLLQLVNQLLDVAKMKSTVGMPRWQRANIVPLLTMLAESMQQLAASQQVALAYEPDAKEQVTDFVSDYVQKIAINLLSNAVKNTPSGGSVTLRSRCGDGCFVLSVSDTGNGISPEDLPHIFEPFYQGQNAQKAQSTGIGLTLTKQLVEAMGGTITVESTMGKGTTFTVDVPRMQKGVTVEETATPVIPENDHLGDDAAMPVTLTDSTLGDDDSSTRVLIVEDNREVAFYTGSLFAPHYDVFYAADGEEGIEKARRLMPDIIVTDVMMPRVDGLELCRRIRHDELTCHIPVIVVTAKVTENDRLEGLHAGATAYLNKPFNADELLTMTDNLLRQQREIQKRIMSIKKDGTLVPAPNPNGEGEHNGNLREDELASAMVHAEMLCPEAGGGEMNELDLQFLERLREQVLAHMEHSETDMVHLAPLMAMSQTQLRRKILAVTGISAAKYVTLLRVEKAEELLRQYPKVTIIEVAYSTGFADNSHFTKVFHRITGMTPMQFIKDAQKASPV